LKVVREWKNDLETRGIKSAKEAVKKETFVANGWIVHPRCTISWNAKHTITNSLHFLTYQLIFILAFITGDETRQILTTGKNHP